MNHPYGHGLPARACAMVGRTFVRRVLTVCPFQGHNAWVCARLCSRAHVWDVRNEVRQRSVDHCLTPSPSKMSSQGRTENAGKQSLGYYKYNHT